LIAEETSICICNSRTTFAKYTTPFKALFCFGSK